ncbi:hypothetical protein KBH77_02970 [Patescibacteria group bacterium]|nr:hypothetical protein [Patescibacteria group bacterium]
MEIIQEMFFLLVPIFSIVSISTALAILLKRLLAETLLPTIAFVILLLFLFGLLNFKGCLLIGYIIIILLSLASVIFSIKTFLNDKKTIRNISFITGLLLIFLFLGISLFINYQRKYIEWDEFSYWGSNVKSLYTFDALQTYKESKVVIKSYIPGMPLFQYFFTRLFPEFVEFPSYIASNFLFFALICVFIKKNFNIKNFLVITGALLLPLLANVNFYNSLYVDTILGILFGCTLLFYYNFDTKKDILFSLILSISTAIILTLTKDMGLVFTLIGNFIIIIDLLLFKRKQYYSFFLGSNSFKAKVKRFFVYLSPSIIAIALELLWLLHLHISKGNSTFNVAGESFFSFIQQGQISSTQIEIFHSFINALKTLLIFPINFSFLKIISFITTTFLILLISDNHINKLIKKRLLISFISLIIGNFIYLGILLYSYMFIFSNYEGLRLASYNRYMLSYLIVDFFFLLVFFIIQGKSQIELKTLNNTLNNIKNVIYCITIFFIFNFLYENTKYPISLNVVHARESVSKTIETRKPYDEISKWSKYITNTKEKTCMISQADQGLNKLILMHTVYPSNTEWLTDYSISMTPYYENDPWSMIISPDNWQQYIIKNYDFVYIFIYDENFIQLYGQFFDNIKQYQLYTVNTDTNGNLRLISVQE